jgi:hypothetical protein
MTPEPRESLWPYIIGFAAALAVAIAVYLLEEWTRVRLP